MSGRELVVGDGRLELPAVLSFVDDSCRALDVAEEPASELRLAIEEIVTNVAAHGYRGAGEVAIRMEREGGAVRVTVADRAPRFDPVEAPAPDLAASWEERALGGLGWHLVRRTMDSVEHQDRPGGGNIVILTKKL